MTAAQAESTRTVSLDYELAAPPQKVWRALTEKDLLARWLMPNDFVAKVGHRFQFRYPMPGGASEGIVNCEVLELTPPSRMRLAWDGGGRVVDSVVTWTLTATDAGTRIKVEQTGFAPDAKQEYNGATYGWNAFFGQNLPKLLPDLK